MGNKIIKSIKIGFVLTVIYIVLSGRSLSAFTMYELLTIIIPASFIAYLFVDDPSPAGKFEGDTSDIQINRDCPVCRTTGRVKVQDVSLDGLVYEREERCENCKGRGVL